MKKNQKKSQHAREENNEKYEMDSDRVRIVLSRVNKDGDLELELEVDGKISTHQVQEFVAKTFIPKENSWGVIHLNDNKLNNKATKLAQASE